MIRTMLAAAVVGLLFLVVASLTLTTSAEACRS
jgi:hypothetical protein